MARNRRQLSGPGLTFLFLALLLHFYSGISLYTFTKYVIEFRLATHAYHIT